MEDDKPPIQYTHGKGHHCGGLGIAGRCYEAEICAILLHLRCSFPFMYIYMGLKQSLH